MITLNELTEFNTTQLHTNKTRKITHTQYKNESLKKCSRVRISRKLWTQNLKHKDKIEKLYPKNCKTANE